MTQHDSITKYDTVLLITRYGCRTCIDIYGAEHSGGIIYNRNRDAIWYRIENDVEIYRAGIIPKHTEFGNNAYEKPDGYFTTVPPAYQHMHIEMAPCIVYLHRDDMNNYTIYSSSLYDYEGLKRWILHQRSETMRSIKDR